jgi:CO/xanthine dehydrogenase FAD-binding subunit
VDAKTIMKNIRKKGLIKTAKLAVKNIKYTSEYFRWKAKGKSDWKKLNKIIKTGDEEAVSAFDDIPYTDDMFGSPEYKRYLIGVTAEDMYKALTEK